MSRAALADPRTAGHPLGHTHAARAQPSRRGQHGRGRRRGRLLAQAIYRHFGSRAGLLTELLESIDVAEGAPRAVERVFAAESGRESIDALFEWWVDYVPRFVGIARGVLAAKHADGDLRLAWEDRMQALLSVCRAWPSAAGSTAPRRGHRRPRSPPRRCGHCSPYRCGSSSRGRRLERRAVSPPTLGRRRGSALRHRSPRRRLISMRHRLRLAINEQAAEVILA